MSSRRTKDLTDDDRVLWTLVAKSTTPLKGKSALEVPSSPVPKQEDPPKAVPNVVASAKPQAIPPKQWVSASLDAPTLDKLSKGRLPIEGRVDLHGMTQDQAHSLLLSFLKRAHAGGVRYVLVITGKGSSSGGDGVLRRAVPHWLATPPFRALVSSHDLAARHHGGSGAIYIRLRRQKAAHL